MTPEELNLLRTLNRNQSDLIYQINEKEKTKNRENHDKLLEERTAKLLEAEYLRKIEQYKIHQNIEGYLNALIQKDILRL